MNSSINDLNEKTLERIEQKLDRIKIDFQNFKLTASVDIAQLKIKAGIWGIIGGAIPTIAALIFWMLRGIK